MGEIAEKEFRYRIEKLEKYQEESEKVHKEILERLHDKDISDAVIRQQLDTLVKATGRIESKIDQQQTSIHKNEKEALAKPAKRWDTIITTAISSIVSALVGAGLALLLK